MKDYDEIEIVDDDSIDSSADEDSSIDVPIGGNRLPKKDKKKLNPLHMREQRQVFAILHFARNNLVEFMGLKKDNDSGV
jgi:hypothetical protein